MIRGAMIIEEGESVEQLDDDDGPNLPNGLSILPFRQLSPVREAK